VSTYHDSRIECTDSEIKVRGYYFPWGTKRIAYSSIRAYKRFDLGSGVLNGRYRIWGSGDLRHWANLDPGRPRKQVGFFLTVGRHVVPFLTPDDPDGFEAALRTHAPAATGS
jgi:hypothetical protein